MYTELAINISWFGFVLNGHYVLLSFLLLILYCSDKAVALQITCHQLRPIRSCCCNLIFYRICIAAVRIAYGKC